MKYSVSGRQPYSVLQKADEIRVQWQDRDRILDFIEKIPDKTIILSTSTIKDSDWDTLTMYAEKLDFIVALYDLKYVPELKKRNIKFCWAFPVNSYYELRGIADMGPAYILISEPLCFNLEKVSKCGIPLRMIANVAQNMSIARESGIYGAWIRPEDADAYGQYIAAIDFVTESLEHEATLLNIYKEKKTWPGNLNLLFTGFGVNVDNRAILENLGEARMNCGQRCMEDGTCHLCYNTLNLAKLFRDKHYELKQNSNN